MKKSLLVAALIAAACSTAFAAEVKQDQKAPTVKATVMSDADMDKVTAGTGASTVYVFAPNNKFYCVTPGLGRSPVSFNCP